MASYRLNECAGGENPVARSAFVHDVTRREAHTASSFFKEISPKVRFDGNLIVVTHLLEDRMPLLEALDAIAPIAYIVPKPNSIHEPTKKAASQRWPVRHLSRNDLKDESWIEDFRSSVRARRFIALDIGGYWSHALNTFSKHFPKQLIGVVEGTKNGFARYRDCLLPVPCVDISNTAIKRTEECPVGDSIASSVESFLRSDMHSNFHLKQVLVIGFGGIGQAVAQALLSNVRPAVWDRDPVARAFARSKKFWVPSREEAIKTADVIICATGNNALVASDYPRLKDGAVIFCATSSDDELDEDALARRVVDDSNPRFLVCHNGRGHFYVAMHGHAINFLQGAEVRPFIRLVQAGSIGAIDILLQNPRLPEGICELDEAVQRRLAEVFEDYFFWNS